MPAKIGTVWRGRARQGPAGVNMLADAVTVTLGPRGRNVVLEKSWGAPNVTKDGVTVAKEIELADKFENMGAQMVKEVASKTSDVAGDGTTTATVLARALFTEGREAGRRRPRPDEPEARHRQAVAAVIEELKKLSKSTKGKDEIAQVGTVSANGDRTIGDMIAEAMEKVGKEGVITVEEAKSLETQLDVVEGMQFDRGYLEPVLRHRSGSHGGRPRGRLHPHPREEDLVDEGPPAAARAGGARRQAAAGPRRGGRGRGAGHARRQQDPRHASAAAP